MSTEGASPRFADLDTWGDAEILATMVEGQLAAAASVRTALPALARAVEAAVPRLKAGGRLGYVGAGTSGRIGVQDGVELTPTFSWPAERLAFFLAGGEPSLMRTIERAEDDTATAEAEVDAAGIGADDVVIGVAASGTTPYTLAAVTRARRRGALTIGVANNSDAPLLDLVEHAILLDTGPEVIAGSTRMKAGTSQKIALNLFSTLAMIRLGRVYGGFMVDLQASNRKLVRRSIAMLVRLTGCTEMEADEALRRAGGRVKTAVLVLRGLSPKEADALLEQTEGHLRAALATL